MERIEGLFNFYRDEKEGKVYLEILPDQLDKDYLYSAKFERGTGERGLYGTIMMDEFVFQWHRMGKQIQWVQKNLRFRADEGSPAERAVAHSFSDSVLLSAKILSEPPWVGSCSTSNTASPAAPSTRSVAARLR